MFRRWISTLIAVSILLSSSFPARPLSLVTPAPIFQEDVTIGAGVLFRTTVMLRRPTDRARLDQLGIVVLSESADHATVLVDTDQLETLARLQLKHRVLDDLKALVMANAQIKPWLATSLQPLLKQAAGVRAQLSKLGVTHPAESLTALRTAMRELTTEQKAGLAAFSSIDNDGDGLTNTEEQWWCTDTNVPNSDGDAHGYSDGQEVAALLDFTLPRTVRWNYGPPFGPPSAWPDFNGQDGNPNTPACNDGDYDTIPDYAEAYVVGTRVGTGDSENTDGDKFDDGQELFGTTYCPGAPLSCGYGSYPRVLDWGFITAGMPAWVRPPGDSPFVAAYPAMEFQVDPSTIHIVTKEIRTIERTISQGEEIATGFTETEGKSTTVGTIDTNTHSTWQENSTTEGGIEPATISYATDGTTESSFALAPSLPSAAFQSNDTNYDTGAQFDADTDHAEESMPEFFTLDISEHKSLGLILPTGELALRVDGKIERFGVSALTGKFVSSGDILFIDKSLALSKLGPDGIINILPAHSANAPLLVSPDKQQVAYLKPADFLGGSPIPSTNGIAVLNLSTTKERLLLRIPQVTVHLYGWSGTDLVVEIPDWSTEKLRPADSMLLALLSTDKETAALTRFASIPALLPNSSYPQTSFDQAYIAYQTRQGVIVESLTSPTYFLIMNAQAPLWEEDGLNVVRNGARISVSINQPNRWRVSRINQGITISRTPTPPLAADNQHLNTTTSAILYRPVSENTPISAYRDLDGNTGAIRDLHGHSWSINVQPGWPCDHNMWYGPTGFCYGHSYDNHEGTDYDGIIGDPIYASGIGTAISVVIDCANTYPNGPLSYGTYILINHGMRSDGNSYETGYGHLKCDGVQVAQGSYIPILPQRIAQMGNTGYSDGDHLHLNVYQNGSLIDPYNAGVISDSSNASRNADACDVPVITSSVTQPATLPGNQKRTWFSEILGRVFTGLLGKLTRSSSLAPVSSDLPGCSGTSCIDQVGSSSNTPLNFSDARSSGQCGGSSLYADSGGFGVGGGGSGMAINDNDNGTWDRLRVWSQTLTNGEGYSTSHSDLRSESTYNEISRSRVNTLVSSEAWSTATTIDPTDAAELTFNYSLKNVGSDAAVNLTNMDVNILIGDLPVITWRAPDRSNIFPGQTVGPFGSASLKLSLDQLAAIDDGAPIRVVLADYGYNDQLYDQNAWGRSVLFHIDDGVADGDRTEDTYLIASQLVQDETYQQTLARHFPTGVFDNGPDDPRTGTLTNIRTPEFDGSGEITGWFDHPVGPHAWWEVAISAGGETSGTLHFKDMPAKAKTDVYLRYLVDSDGDGYTDIAEKDAFSDPNNADIHPRPLLIAAQHTDVNSNTATVQLSLQNNGNFDASSVEVWAVAPDDSITISDNLIGGGGRVRAGSRVVVGARIGAPDLTTWITSTTKPYLSGQFQGLSAKTYIFRADTSGTTGSTVGLTISWTDDGATWTPLNVGSGYTTQNPIAVADGVNVAFTAGTIRATERFTVETALPIDTFAYTINRTPYTPPLIVVSYNDPQGNHKFASGVEIPEIQVDLTPYQGMMRYGLELDALNSQPFQLGANTTYFLFNNPTDTPILGGKLFAEMATPDGTVAHEYVVTDTIFQPGPNIVPLNWNTLDFTPTFSATQDYHVLVFVTDRQGTIIENTVKDFDALGRDRLPTAVIPSTAWDFGTVTQGEILNHTFTIANTGFTDLLAYISAQAEIGLSQQGSKHVSPGDMAEYVITLDTSTQAVGAFSRILTLRTSDPTNPTRTFTVLGNIVAPSGAANAFDLTNRPWDKRVMVYGNVAQYTPVDFAENIQPDSASIEPCMVYAADGTTLKGTGKYCADFGGGVSSGQMFGDGSDGDVTVTSPMTFQSPMSALASTASAGQTIVNTAAFQPFESGWEILIVQIQGTGVGTYEFATVASRNGNQTTLTQPLLHTYTQSGNSKAFAVRVPHFRNVAVTSSGQWLAPAWNGSEGGIIVFRASGFLTVATGGSIDLSARGFRGGPWVRHQHGYQGEGTPGAGGQVNPPGNANGNGGGGGRSDASAGGGGGNGTDGGTGAGSGEGPGGDGGITSGSADLSVMTLGGGGGGGTADWNAPAYGGDGAAGGASAIIFAQNVTVGGTLTSFGGNGNNGFAPGGTDQDDGFGGAGGAGGSILLKAQNASVGTNLISAIGGSGGNGCDNGMCGRYAGNGGIGRIRIEYCDTLSGTTNPPASTQKLTCYIAEKTSDTNVHFTVPDVITNGQNYVMHFGRHFTFGVSGGTIMTPTRLMAQNYANATMDALVTNVGAGGSTNLQVMVGTQTIYSASQTITQPTSISLNNFASALNAYLASQPANTLIDVPMTVTLDRQADVMLTNLALTPGANVDASIVTGDIAFGTLTPTEGASVPITLTLHNTGNIDSGGLTAAVFATPTLGSAWYIGSVYVPNIPANGTTQATIQWDTLGFTGTTPVRVVVDPYNRIAEADENNNTVATTLTIRTQPDLNFAALTLFNDEPVTSELVTVTLPLHNLGQTAAGAHSVALYQGNPDAGGILIGAVNQSGLAGNTTTPITFTWTPTATGSYRLFARADRNGQVNEADEGNNDLWKDVYVGIRGPILIDSGAASDEPYTGTIGYGYVDLGQPDVIVPCGSQSHETLRMDPGGQIGYRFDHLLPGHFYHLDVTLYECDGAGRQESIFVDGNRIAGPEELIDGRVHRLSLRLDPALYADRTISITIEAPGIDGAVVSAINLFDIDYRYANAGGVNDPAYPGGRWTNFGRAYGYTNGVTNTLWGTLPYSSVHVNQISNTVYYRFDGLLPVKQYQINLTFWQPSGAAREQKVQIDGTDTSTTINTGDYQLHQLALDIPNNTYGDGRIDVGIVRTNAATGAFVNEIALEELTAVLPPVTNFTALPTSGYAPLPVQFTDQSSGAVTSRAWYFGDGGTATIPNPLHTYQSPGVYDVSLATTGPGGTDILTRSHYITVTAITTQTVVRIQPPVASASVGSPITVAVMISNVANLGSFQFTLGFNPTRVQVQAVTLGEFPGSTGRSFTPIGPTIDNTNGTAIFGAFSLGGTPPGPNGSGNLAYVRLQPISGGTSVLALSNVQVSNVAGSSLPFITQDGLLSIAACLGDFDGDGDVDILDVQRVAYRWGSHTGQPLYDSLYDVEPLGAPDGDIDILDVQVVAYRWGTHCSTGRSARLLAATAPATLSIQPYSRTVSATQTFTTTVWISDVADLGAFEFTLAYSPTVIEVMSATIASFPTSTGRAFTPAGLIISPTGSTATYGAFSLGATPPGANGNGALAIVTLKALSAGQSNLNFNAAQISDRSGAAQVIGSMLDGMIEVVAQTEWKVYLPLVQK